MHAGYRSTTCSFFAGAAAHLAEPVRVQVLSGTTGGSRSRDRGARPIGRRSEGDVRET